MLADVVAMLARSAEAIFPFHAPDVSGQAMSFEPSSPKQLLDEKCPMNVRINTPTSSTTPTMT